MESGTDYGILRFQHGTHSVSPERVNSKISYSRTGIDKLQVNNNNVQKIRWTGAEQNMFGGRDLPLAIMNKKKKIKTGFVVGTQKLLSKL